MLLIFALGFPLAAWAVLRIAMKDGPYEMDFDTSHGTFIVLMVNYQKVFYAVFGTGLIGAFLSWNAAHADAAILLLLAAGYALLFNFLVVLFYEGYLHSRYPRNGSAGTSTYSLSRYAVIQSLGASALVMLFAGAVMLVRELVQ